MSDSDSGSPVAKPAKKAAKPAIKKEKKRKDPNAPKKALTAFIIFSNDKRDEVKKANPDIKFGEVAKAISALWKDCTPSEKKKYESAAEKEKERYQREQADYLSRGGEGAAPAKKAKKPAAKKAAPKSESEGESDEEDDEE